MQRYSFNIMRKMSLVNETLRPETEARRLTFSPRRDRDVPTFLRDRDETETLGKCVSRPSRDRDVETETTSLLSSLSNTCTDTPDGVVSRSLQSCTFCTPFRGHNRHIMQCTKHYGSHYGSRQMLQFIST